MAKQSDTAQYERVFSGSSDEILVVRGENTTRHVLSALNSPSASSSLLCSVGERAPGCQAAISVAGFTCQRASMWAYYKVGIVGVGKKSVSIASESGVKDLW